MNSQKNQRSSIPSSSISSKPVDNIYKSYTYRPQTKNFGKDFHNYSMRHKKVLSHDAQGYKQRVRNAIIEIFSKQNHGILVKKLKQMLSNILGFQIQNELLGVSKFTDFILVDMQNVCTMKVIVNPHCPEGEYMYVVSPINDFNQNNIRHMTSWNNSPMFYQSYTQNQIPGINTPTTCDRSRMTQTNLDNMLEKNHSLNHNSRKDYYFSPKMDNSFQNMANYKQCEKKSVGMVSYLSEISKNDQHDDFSMTSYGISKDLTIDKKLPIESIEKHSDQEFDVYEKDTLKSKEKTGFNYCVFNNDSLQVVSAEEDDIADDMKCKSYKSSDEDFLIGQTNNLVTKKKQIRLSKSSYKKRGPILTYEGDKLLKYLEI